MRSDDGKKLLQGLLVDIGGGGGEQESEFFPGQLLGGEEECDGENGFTADVKFVAGQWSDGEGGAEGFLLGQVGPGGEVVMGQTVSTAQGGVVEPFTELPTFYSINLDNTPVPV